MSSKLLERVVHATPPQPVLNREVIDLPILDGVDIEQFPEMLWILENSKKGIHGIGYSAKHQEHGVACFPNKIAALKFNRAAESRSPGAELKPKQLKFDDARNIVKAKPPEIRTLLFYKDGNVQSEPKVHYCK